MPQYTPPPPPKNWRKGTRALRWRSLARAPQQGQPFAPFTDPDRIPHAEPEHHVCAECFGPRNRYQEGMFCARCEQSLFGDSRMGYLSFIRSERMKLIHRRRRWPS